MVFFYHFPRTLMLRNSVRNLCHCVDVTISSLYSTAHLLLSIQCSLHVHHLYDNVLSFKFVCDRNLKCKVWQLGFTYSIISHLKCSRYSHEEQQHRCSFVFNIILLSDPAVILTVPNSANGHCKLIFSNIYQT